MVKIENYYKDGDISWSEALERFDADSSRPMIGELPRGDLKLNRTFRPTRQISLIGQGLGTKLLVNVERDAINITGGGTRSEFKHFTINGRGQEHAPKTAGIVMNGRATCEDLIITGPFGNGIRIEADVTNSGTNSNLWTIKRTQINYTQHAGILVRGGDSNAGYGEQISVVHCCQNALNYKVNEWWTIEWPYPAGIVDNSFLGNTWVACHTSANNGYSGYRATGASARSVFLGCYREQNQPSGWLSPQSIAIGGLSTWGGGVSIQRQKLFGITLVAPTIETDSNDQDSTPLLMQWQTHDSKIRGTIEATQEGFRGAFKHANSKTAWWWNVLRAKWTSASH